MKRPRPHIEDYTVGWVCALPIELAAATAMLDDEHPSLPYDEKDPNLYTLGRIGDHNVALACLPAGQMGTNSAAVVATRMQIKFPSIRIGLMVGIGGGVPSQEAGVRLGDVVISQPHAGHGGVVQYDFGKAVSGGQVTPTGFLNTPPTVLLNAIVKLRSNHYLGRCGLPTHMSAFAQLQQFSRDEAGPDVLYEAMYNHTGGLTCDGCSKERMVKRDGRTNQEIAIHYGTIASGNQVVKDGVTRDKRSLELGGVQCFEMEAAGLMNNFPCLVIRGICDYADSHKNKRWQPYAAATAAACAKELLTVIPAAEVVETPIMDGNFKRKEGVRTALTAEPSIAQQSNLRDMRHAIDDVESSIKSGSNAVVRRLDMVQIEAAHHQDAVQETMSRTANRTDDGLRRVDRSLNRIRQEQEHFLQQQEISNSRLLAQIEDAKQTLAEKLESIKVAQPGNSGPFWEGESLESMTLPLLIGQPALLSIMSALAFRDESELTPVDVSWLELEFEYLLATTHEAAGKASRRRAALLGSPAGGRSLSAPYVHRESGQNLAYRIDRGDNLRGQPSFTLQSGMHLPQKSYAFRTAVGPFLINIGTINTPSPDSGEPLRSLVFYFNFRPHLDHCGTGVSGMVFKQYRASDRPSVGRFVRSFSVMAHGAWAIENTPLEVSL